MEVEGPGQPWCPGGALVVALFGSHIAQEQCQVSALHFLGRRTGGDLELEILVDPPGQVIGQVVSKMDESRGIVSYGLLGYQYSIIGSHLRSIEHRTPDERALSS